jgi:phage shock protein C
MASEGSDRGRSTLLIAGIGLIVFGLWAMVSQAGIIPDWVYRNWSELRGGLSLILLGVLVVWFARGGLRPSRIGARLYRTKDDRWVAGVLGGLGRYFGIEPTVLRLLFIALVLLGAGWPVAAYIVMAIIVPSDPQVRSVEATPPAPAPAPAPAQAPSEAATPAPEIPEPPAPPVAPEPPAPPSDEPAAPA